MVRVWANLGKVVNSSVLLLVCSPLCAFMISSCFLVTCLAATAALWLTVSDSHAVVSDRHHCASPELPPSPAAGLPCIQPIRASA